MRIKYGFFDDKRCLEVYSLSAELVGARPGVDIPRAKRCVTVLAVHTADDDDYVVGYANIIVSDDGLCLLHAVYVHPEYRGKGIGTGLVRNAVEVAKRIGCERLRAEVVDAEPLTNAAAMRRILEKLGFRRVEDDVYVMDLGRG